MKYYCSVNLIKSYYIKYTSAGKLNLSDFACFSSKVDRKYCITFSVVTSHPRQSTPVVHLALQSRENHQKATKQEKHSSYTSSDKIQWHSKCSQKSFLMRKYCKCLHIGLCTWNKYLRFCCGWQKFSLQDHWILKKFFPNWNRCRIIWLSLVALAKPLGDRPIFLTPCRSVLLWEYSRLPKWEKSVGFSYCFQPLPPHTRHEVEPLYIMSHSETAWESQGQ